MEDFWDKQRRIDLERKAKEYGINNSVFNLEKRVQEAYYKKLNSKKNVLSNSNKEKRPTGIIGFVVLMLVFGTYFGQKIIKHYKDKNNYEQFKVRLFRINSPDNTLIGALEGKRVTDWAKALEKYATQKHKIKAQVYRDLADSTEFAMTFKEQEQLLQLFGEDYINSEPNMTREKVRQVQKKYK